MQGLGKINAVDIRPMPVHGITGPFRNNFVNMHMFHRTCPFRNNCGIDFGTLHSCMDL